MKFGKVIPIQSPRTEMPPAYKTRRPPPPPTAVQPQTLRASAAQPAEERYQPNVTIQDTNHSPHWLLKSPANIIRNTANQSPATPTTTIRPSAWPLELTAALANDILHAPGSPIAPASKRATRPAIRWPRGRAQKGCTATESTTTASQQPSSYWLSAPAASRLLGEACFIGSTVNPAAMASRTGHVATNSAQPVLSSDQIGQPACGAFDSGGC